MKTLRKHGSLLAGLIVVLICGCQSPPPPSPVPASAPAVPVAATPAGTPAPALPVVGSTYIIDSERSWLRILVYKTGRLARFGHNHVISSSDVEGQVVLDDAEPMIVLSLPLAKLIVDDNAARAAEGEDFPGEIPQKDRDGTRGNMLGEALLNASQYPTLALRSVSVRGDGPDFEIDAAITLAGKTSTISFPVKVERDDQQLVATGRTQILHDQLGLTPFSALLGALSVRNDIGLHYYLVARRDDAI